MSTSCSLGGLELSLQQGFDSAPSTFFNWKSIILSTVPVSISRSTNRRNMCDVYKHVILFFTVIMRTYSPSASFRGYKLLRTGGPHHFISFYFSLDGQINRESYICRQSLFLDPYLLFFSICRVASVTWKRYLSIVSFWHQTMLFSTLYFIITLLLCSVLAE